MSEIVKFVNNGSANITPAVAEKVLRHLPQWKLEFTQINAPNFPHLVDQLEFLTDAVEDAVEGAYKRATLLGRLTGGVCAALRAQKDERHSRRHPGDGRRG